MVWAVPWLLLVERVVENTAAVDFVTSALNAVAILGIGYLLPGRRVRQQNVGIPHPIRLPDRYLL